MNKSSFDPKDFLEATSDAAKRTRFFMIVLVVISVLAFAGYMNSIENSWMLSRMKTVGNENSDYVKAKLGFKPEKNKDEKFDDRYISLHSAVTRTYVENALTMRVPFFGVAFDINDLGLLSGLSFIIVLGLLKFSIRSETISLRIYFKTVKRASQNNLFLLEEFYDLLAIKFVFTTPKLEDDDDEEQKWQSKTSKKIRFMPKLVCLLPIAIYLLVAINDFASIATGYSINKCRTYILPIYTTLLLIAIFLLSKSCVESLIKIEQILDYNWSIISTYKDFYRTTNFRYYRGKTKTDDKENNLTVSNNPIQKSVSKKRKK